MGYTKQPGRNFPVNLSSFERLEARMGELMNPTTADLSTGLNPGASNSNGTGVHSEVYNVIGSPIGSWPRPTPEAGGLIGQHIGLDRVLPEDYVVLGSRPCAYVQATATLPSGAPDPSTGVFNVSDSVIPIGAWYWGTLEGLPFGTRVTGNQDIRVTSDGFCRVVAL